MRKFLKWLFNPRNAGISSALIVGFVAGMGGMSFYIGTMTDTGSLADWFSALGTIGAVAVSLYLASSKEKKYVDLQFSSVEIIHKNTDAQNHFELNFKFNVYNAGTKPFLLERIILRREGASEIENSYDVILINPGEMKMFQDKFKMPGKSWAKSNLDQYLVAGNKLYIELVGNGEDIFKISISESGTQYSRRYSE
ncbi:hypothetical protein SOP56_02520 [Weissella confusa]|uniref:hypothetical protein n=1 Tax=Weissella confusa TaxID=1583 RepID=UPI002A7603A0|nr:hypothetical protein [Weissella confusa]MDY2528731.1 hypothetical protein [Weissella confusa]